jgi:RNA polymerase sigma-70 factor, ECF subfamily
VNSDLLAQQKNNMQSSTARLLKSIHNVSDEDLVRLFQEGNRDAFRLLVERNQDKVRSLIYYTLNRSDIVDDLTQEIFLKVYNGLHSFRFDSKFYTWLYRITINKCRDELRKKWWKRFVPLSDAVISNSSVYVTHTVEPGTDDGFSDAVRTALQKLPKHQREIIILKDIEDHSYEEISEILDCEMGTVKSRLSRARSALRIELQPYLPDEV